jgi:hypothetical protein
LAEGVQQVHHLLPMALILFFLPSHQQAVELAQEVLLLRKMDQMVVVVEQLLFPERLV